MSDTFTVHVPMTFQRRGGRKLIVAPDGTTLPTIAPRFNIDSVLMKALARAFRWQKLLDQGTYSTIKEIAAKEKVDPSYVGDVLRLTLLAPDIIEMILDGRQQPGLQYEWLRKSFPLEWQTQRDGYARLRVRHTASLTGAATPCSPQYSSWRFGRYGAKSGRIMLPESIVEFDPTRTLAERAKAGFRLYQANRPVRSPMVPLPRVATHRPQHREDARRIGSSLRRRCAQRRAGDAAAWLAR